MHEEATSLGGAPTRLVAPSWTFSRSSAMSSQDSDGESYVSHLVANPRVYGDTDPYGWTTDEEEDADLREKQGHSNDEDEEPHYLNQEICTLNSRGLAYLT